MRRNNITLCTCDGWTVRCSQRQMFAASQRLSPLASSSATRQGACEKRREKRSPLLSLSLRCKVKCLSQAARDPLGKHESAEQTNMNSEGVRAFACLHMLTQCTLAGLSNQGKKAKICEIVMQIASNTDVVGNKGATNKRTLAHRQSM